MRKVAGFTLIEALVVIAITGIMLGVLLANYRRSNENSLLIREVASVMSHIRLAQETAASSKITEAQNNNDELRFCENDIHRECDADSDCPGSPGVQRCALMPPAGGEVIKFDCGSNEYDWYADTVQCKANCFLGAHVFADAELLLNASDNIIHHGTDPDGAGVPPHLEDYKRERLVWDAKVQVKDIKISNAVAYAQCTGLGGNRTVWNGSSTLAPTSSAVPVDRELSATIQFTSESGDAFSASIGRKVILTDNVAPTSADGAHTPWSKVEILMGLVNRTTDCRLVIMTDKNVLTDTPDADCAI